MVTIKQKCGKTITTALLDKDENLHCILPEFSTSFTANKYGELTATATIQVARIKKGHNLDLISGERSGNTTAPNRSTAIRIRF